MESAIRTHEILLRWWNFAGVGLSGQALCVEKVETGLERWTENDSVSLKKLVIQRNNLGPNRISATNRKPNSGPGHVSLLDTYLDEYFDFEALELFEESLVGSQQLFRVMADSGKTYIGSLSLLCSMRIASLMALQPNRAFFVIPDEPTGLAVKSETLSFDLWCILPTLSARAWRQNLSLYTSNVFVSKAHLYLFGNYLPDFIGNCVVTASPPGTSPAGGSLSSVHQGVSVVKNEILVDKEGETLGFHIFRLSLLALASVVKMLAEKRVVPNKLLTEISRRLVGPTSSRGVFGRHEYRLLKRLVE